jgi:lipopolysaccharide transport system ATP-binding protein
MKMIEIENLSKRFRIPHLRRDTLKESFLNIFKKNQYEIFNAVEDLSFSINKGEFFGIIGRNGSGKSTLLKMIANIYKPTKGSIKVNGSIAPFLELGVGFNPELSGRENVYLNGIILGLRKSEIDKKYNEIVEFAEMERFMDQKLKNYSSGMQVRLAFSIAIQADTDILLLDEVLAVGDINFQQKCLSKMMDFKKQGKTIVLVTHDLGTVRRYCDRVLYIQNGQGIAIGETNEITNKYIYEDKNENTAKIFKPADKEKEYSKRFGNRKIEILSIELKNKFGEISNSFACEDKIEIDVKYQFNQKVDPPVFGMEIYDAKDNYCFASNTFLRNIKTENLINNNKLKIIIERLPFLIGEYYLTFAFQCEGFNETYDWIEKGFYFNVINKTNDVGFVKTDVKFLIP